MARIKISKVAKDLNVALPTVVEFLRGKNISVDDNPNARIEEDVVELLENAFKSDKDQKGKSQQLSTDRARDREKAKPAPAPREVEEIKLQSEINKPRIIGKIELDRHGNPVRPATTPAQAAKPAVEPTPAKEPEPAPVAAPAATVQEPAAEKAEIPEPEKAPAIKAEEKPKAESPVKAEQAAAPREEKRPAEKPTPVATQPAAAEADVTAKETANADASADNGQPKDEKEEIFSVGIPQNRPTINVVGKIDLSAINQSTRPKKKSKEERRNERIAKAGGAAHGGDGANGDRKKRKRIGGKEKIDIEKTSNQPGGNGGGGRGRGNEKSGGKGDRNRRGGGNSHNEVNEEDVQKQVKEVLARLTAKDKGQKRGVKWRKEKREAIAEREREAADILEFRFPSF